MSASNAFTNQGPTSELPTSSMYNNPFTGQSPYASALNNVANNPVKTAAKPLNQMTVSEAQASGQYPAYQKLVSGVLPPTGQDVKSHSIGADGSVTQTYHPKVDTTKPADTTSKDNTKPTGTTFSGMINTGVGASSGAAGTGATNYSNANTGLITSTQGNQQYADRAKQIGDTLGSEIEKTKAGFGNLMLNGAGTSPVAEGNAGLAYNNMSNRISALSEQAQQELAGNAQGLTAQQQTQSGYNQASGNALTGQGQGITGLNNLASTVKPEATSQGQTTYNSLTNTFSGGSYGTNLATVVQAIKNGSMGYTTGVNSLSSLSPTAKADVLAALGAGFDTVASDANAATKGSNIQTSGVTPVNAAASVYEQGYGQLLDLQNTVSNVDSFGTLLLNNMGGINPTDAKFGNKTISEIRNQLSSSQQGQFDTTFAQLKAQIATLLSTGGSQIPTQITADANKIIDGSAPIGTLTATLDRIKTEGSILTSNLQSKMNTAGSVIGAPKAGNNSNPLGI